MKCRYRVRVPCCKRKERLLPQDLSDAIDGRTWPAESEADVRSLTSALCLLKIQMIMHNCQRICMHCSAKLAMLRSNLVAPAPLSCKCCKRTWIELTALTSEACMPCASAAGQAGPGAHPERHGHWAQRVLCAGEQQRRCGGVAAEQGLHVAARGRLWARCAALGHQARPRHCLGRERRILGYHFAESLGHSA